MNQSFPEYIERHFERVTTPQKSFLEENTDFETLRIKTLLTVQELESSNSKDKRDAVYERLEKESKGNSSVAPYLKMLVSTINHALWANGESVHQKDMANA
ncbi:MAG: hypothetical protein OEY94_03260 [Alphaproteobacteria bacterium]|nr:hypothetical protein [Alphaproteobacteria bacterium]